MAVTSHSIWKYNKSELNGKQEHILSMTILFPYLWPYVLTLFLFQSCTRVRKLYDCIFFSIFQIDHLEFFFLQILLLCLLIEDLLLEKAWGIVTI